MTFREFCIWCNERSYDGKWDMLTAMICLDLMDTVKKTPFWKRERTWNAQYEKQVLEKIIGPFDQKNMKNIMTFKKENSTMTINEYQGHALRTESRITADPVPYIRILEGLMGLNGEAGEAIDIMKKVLFQNHGFDREHLAKELGDIAWYLAIAADAIGYDLETILKMNVDKLKARYPDGFNAEHSQNRSADDI